MSGPGSTIRWRWVAILILLGGGAQLAPLVSPGILFPWSVVWLLLLVAIAGTLVREIANRSWLVTTTLVVAAIGIPAALLGVDWSGRWGTYLPCRRNWEWLPSYFLRASPTQSLTGEVGQTRFKICYGSPRVRGRKVIGGPTVPF